MNHLGHLRDATAAEAARQGEDERALLARFKASLAHLDPDPVAVEEHGPLGIGDLAWHGFYAGKVVASDDRRAAIWSRGASRVAVVPLTERERRRLPVGAIVAFCSWGLRARYVMPLGRYYDFRGARAVYDWLDAFDDFTVMAQRELEREDFLHEGVDPARAFALGADGLARVRPAP